MADHGGQQLGNYRLLRLLGKGGFGEVYEAEHILLHRRQAIKLLLEQHFSNPKFGERFLREAQTLAALDHPNIVHVDELGIQGELVYLVMPFISGGTLHDVLKQRAGPLGLSETRHYLEQICAALRYAHSQHIVHLDLKPLNLLIHQDGRLLLSDFGLAHLMKQGALEGGTSLTFGSPYYMAPEHLRGQPDWRSDIYALGVMLYQMLAGRLPFEGSTPEAVIVKHVMEPPPALHTVRPDLPEGLEWVLIKALAKDPQQRFASVDALAAAFEQAFRTALTQFIADNQAQAPTIRAASPPASITQVASTPPFFAGQSTRTPSQGVPPPAGGQPCL